MSTDLFLLGASSEAAEALELLVSALPPAVPVAVVVAHPNRRHEDDILQRLAQASSVPVEEIEDKDDIVPGRVYLAPAGYHLLLERGTFLLSRERPIEGERPAAAPLFESAADAYGDGAAGLILVRHVGRHSESAALLQARGGAAVLVGISNTDSTDSKSAGQREVAVLPLEAAIEWMVEMCTGQQLRGGHERRHGS